MQQLVDERIETECSLTLEEKEKAWNNALDRADIFKVVTRKVNHWTQGIMIGNKLKNMELASDYYDAEKLAKRKFKVFKDSTDAPVLSVFRNTIRKSKAPPN